MSESLRNQDFISIAPSHSFPTNETARFQVLNDSLYGALGNSDSIGNLAKHQGGIVMQYD